MYVDIEINRRAKTNLDRIKKGQIDLHGPSSPSNRGLGRSHRYICLIHGTVKVS